MSNEKYKVVATKVKPDVKRQIAKLCKQKGLTEYDMLQMMCDCLVRYMDDQHNLSPELEQAMAIFEHMTGWKEAYNIADPSTGKDVCEAVYVFQDPEGKRHGLRASLIRKPFMGLWHQTDNVVQIYERMTEVLLPEMYRKLRWMAIDNDCNSIVELLHKMIDEQASMQLDAEFRKEFEDAARATNGKTVAYGQRTRRKKHYEPDTMPQPRLDFTDDIGTEEERININALTRDTMGYDPIGGEW